MDQLNRERAQISVLAISGSLRKHSFNTALLLEAKETAPKYMVIKIFDLKDIPFYNADVEKEGDPKPVTVLKTVTRIADGILIATPEYNYGVPGVLKNAIDWASRDEGPGSLIGKPVTVIGAGGSAGTARAQLHLSHILAATGSLTMTKPGFFLSNPWDKIEVGGFFMDREDTVLLKNHIAAFAEWIGFAGGPSTDKTRIQDQVMPSMR